MNNLNRRTNTTTNLRDATNNMAPIAKGRIAFSIIAGQKTADDNDATTPATVGELRDEIFKLGAVMGRTCELFLSFPCNGTHVVLDGDGRSQWSSMEMASGGGEGSTVTALGRLLGEAFLRLFSLSGKCGVDLRTCVLKKMELNGKKYPVELCNTRRKFHL